MSTPPVIGNFTTVGWGSPPWFTAVLAVGLLGAAVGHAYIWTAVLNNLYARPLPKPFLKLWRLLTGLAIAGFPVLAVAVHGSDVWQGGLAHYVVACAAVGLVWFPAVTASRLTRPAAAAVRSERTETVDYFTTFGPAVIGDGKFSWLVRRLPFRSAFRVDYTEITLAVPHLPADLNGLSVVLVTDTHFHGTPARKFYDAIVDRILAGPPADVVVLGGDYLDSDAHRPWIGDVFGRLRATHARLAILGNHDKYHDPPRTRKDLESAGFTVLSNRWEVVSVRGVPCLVSGHEGPWLGNGPDLADAPAGLFHLCVSHTPDKFAWAARSGVNLLLCGHVHGGQIRVPLVGSIFVPSLYGRRYDMGVFERPGTVMVVSRGLGGKEPMRIRCNPQVIRLTLTPADRTG